MKRNSLNALLTERALNFMSVNQGALLDSLLEKHESPAIKNVCAKVNSQLSDEIDELCNLLGMSKRQFLEAAMVRALEEARVVMEEEGVNDYLEALSEQQAREGK